MKLTFTVTLSEDVTPEFYGHRVAQALFDNGVLQEHDAIEVGDTRWSFESYDDEITTLIHSLRGGWLRAG